MWPSSRSNLIGRELFVDEQIGFEMCSESLGEAEDLF